MWDCLGKRGRRQEWLESGRDLLRLSTTTHTNLQMGSPTPQAIGSPEYFHLLKAWIKKCNSDHDCEGGAIEKKKLPTRLIDTRATGDGLLALRNSASVGTGDHVYVALSHRWGEYTREEKELICTHEGNLSERQKGFDMTYQPKTFQDAVEVTRQLGIRYLWIDSLCIIQSLEGVETEDWEKESKRMEDVYSNAYCTLAMHATYATNQGPLDRQTKNDSIMFETSKGIISISKHVDNFWAEVEESPLSRRGWVLQERVLSRRTIHFGAEQTYFECGNGVRCENLAFIEP